MIAKFLDFLNEKSIDYRVTNGYQEISNPSQPESDWDILFKKKDFAQIDKTIKAFSKSFGYVIVQEYHQQKYAKNIFLYNPKYSELLNLDLYGELSRNGIRILNEEEVFSNTKHFKSVSILKPDQEFIQYLVKKIDKEKISKINFDYLMTLYANNKEACLKYLTLFFKNTSFDIINLFEYSNHNLFLENILLFKNDFNNNKKNAKDGVWNSFWRITKRIVKPTGITIAFLGPDGSGKSTIIDLLKKQILPFRKICYFHLKPILKKTKETHAVVVNPHANKAYSEVKSYGKLLYFIYQYNWGWLKNIFLLKRRSTMVIFDRYFDDMLVDYKRYRFGGNTAVAGYFRKIIPQPEIYFILTAESTVILNRKQEVTPKELERQIIGYRNLADNRRYFNIDVSHSPEKIVVEIMNILMKKMNERY